MDAKEKAELLARVPLFATLGPAHLDRLARVTHEESYKLGEKIFLQGQTGDKLYAIVKGRVRISREVPGMGEEALAILGPQAVFGEMALLDDSPRSADARVHESCTVLAIDRESFDALLLCHKDLAYDVLWAIVRVLTQRLRETTDKLTFLATSAKFG